MRSTSLAEAAAGRSADIIPAVLGAAAEGAWLAVVAAAVVAPVDGAGPAGALLPCVIASLVGLVAARLLPMSGVRAVALLGAAAGVVVLAAITGPDAGRASGGAGNLAQDLVLGFAVLRGAAQGAPSAGAGAVEALVRRSPWLLGGAWVFGLTIAGEGRAGFTAAAALDTLLFVVVAALALGSARQAALPPDIRAQLGRNRVWIVMVGVVAAAALVLALPLAAALGGPLGAMAAVLFSAAATVVLGLAGAMVTVLMVVVDAVAGLLRGVFGVTQPSPSQPPPVATPQQPLPVGGGDPASSPIEALIGVLLIAGLLAAAWLLARRWQGARRWAPARPGAWEQRRIDLSARPRPLRIGLPNRLRARLAPADATGAYERLLTDWADSPGQARHPAETPAGHAARLRTAGHGDLGLDLLAADYQLARFAGRRLTAAEDRRAVRRWRRLRSRR